MIVVELGCGALGSYIWPAARTVGAHGRVYAVDVRKPVLEAIMTRARVENLPQVVTLWGNAEQADGVRLADQVADVVTLINVLFQNTDRQTMLAEAIRLLKPGGKLIVVDWLADAPLGPPAEHVVNQSGVVTFCQRSGAALTNKCTPSSMHFGLVFTRGS